MTDKNNAVIEYWQDILNRANDDPESYFTIKQLHLKRILSEIDKLQSQIDYFEWGIKQRPPIA